MVRALQAHQKGPLAALGQARNMPGGGLPASANELPYYVSHHSGSGVPTRCKERLRQAGLCHQGAKGSLG